MKISLIDFVDDPEGYIATILEPTNNVDTIEITSRYEGNTLYLTTKDPNFNTKSNHKQRRRDPVIDDHTDESKEIQELKDKVERLEDDIVAIKACYSSFRDILYSSKGLKNIP